MNAKREDAIKKYHRRLKWSEGGDTVVVRRRRRCLVGGTRTAIQTRRPVAHGIDVPVSSRKKFKYGTWD